MPQKLEKLASLLTLLQLNSCSIALFAVNNLHQGWFFNNPQYEIISQPLRLFVSVSHRCAHTQSRRGHTSGKRWLITLRAPHWDVRNNYLCLAATQDPSGEVIILTRGCSLQSQLIHITVEPGPPGPARCMAPITLITGQGKVLEKGTFHKSTLGRCGAAVEEAFSSFYLIKSATLWQYFTYKYKSCFQTRISDTCRGAKKLYLPLRVQRN